ncbi:MAG: HPP family protein [Candidatus Cloacimonetes bacterium]|nr:HPP family protein [Candidatus Cloacimonadota bacterium]MBS3767503.1 HPP family protein [Candidatus Cloacimonadota bacterium]
MFLKKDYRNMLKEFKRYWKNYVFQSLLAMVVIFFLLLFIDFLGVLVVASIGASTFIIFAMPENITAQPYNIIGGHLVGIIWGGVCSQIPHSGAIECAVVYALAVGLSIFTMVIIDTEHPPATGTSLAVVVQGFSLSIAVSVMIPIIGLSLIHVIFRKQIRNLV